MSREGRGRLPRWDDPRQHWVRILVEHHGSGIRGQESESVRILA